MLYISTGKALARSISAEEEEGEEKRRKRATTAAEVDGRVPRASERKGSSAREGDARARERRQKEEAEGKEVLRI